VSGWTEITSTSDLQKGDLLFFKNDTSDRVSHTASMPVAVSYPRLVQRGKVITSSISTAYWTRNFVNARRVF
jgi:cell wall-associated NlpC family hydrolase